MDLEKIAKFSKILKEGSLEQDSILLASKIFLESSENENEELLKILKKNILEIFSNFEKNSKILQFFYISNDIIYKGKNQNLNFASKFKKLFLEIFQDFENFSESLLSMKVLKKILDVLKIWEEKKIMENNVTNKFILLIKEKINKKKKNSKITKLNFDFEDLVNFAERKKNLKIWEEKLNENFQKKNNEKILNFSNQENLVLDNSIKICKQNISLCKKKIYEDEKIIKSNLETEILKIVVNIGEIDKEIGSILNK